MPVGLKRNAANLVALTAVQASNALIPVLIFPYALLILGAEGYSQVVLAEALSVIVLTAVLFSFEVEGVGLVINKRNPDQKAELSRIISAIVTSRLILFVFSASLVLAGFFAVTGELPAFLALWLLVPLGQVFYSYWFYQGMEDNLPVAVITILSRLTGLAMVYALLDGPEQAYAIPLGIGAPFLVGGLLSLGYIIVKYRLKPVAISGAEIRHMLFGGKEIVVGNIAVMLYRDLNVVLLGFAGVSASGVAAYSLAEKLIKMLQASVRPLSQLFFPKLIGALDGYTRPNRENAKIIARMTLPQIAVVSSLIGILVLGYNIVLRFLPDLIDFEQLRHTSILFAIMLPAILFGIANYMFGVVGLNYLNGRHRLLIGIASAGVSNIFLCTALARYIDATAAAICFVAAELLLFCIILAGYLQRRQQ